MKFTARRGVMRAMTIWILSSHVGGLLPTLPGRFLPPADGIGQQLDGGGGPVDAPPARGT